MSEPACYLCGLPLRHASVSESVAGRRLDFCCHGCRMVYAMLLASTGVDAPDRFRETDLYRQCVAAGVIPAREADLDRIRNREDSGNESPGPAEGAGETAVSDTLPLDLHIGGMWCPACAWVLESVVGRLPGVYRARCQFSTDRMHCRYDPAAIAPDQIQAAVTRLGYRVVPPESSDRSFLEQHRELVRLIVTSLLTANVMMLSWALYTGFFTDLSDDSVAKLSMPIVAMAAVVFFYGGGPMLRKAVFGIRHLAPGMETLVGLAAGCAFAYSVVNWLAGSLHLYFDTASMLIALVLVGKHLEQGAKRSVRRDLEAFFALQPTKVRIVTDADPGGRYTTIDQLAAGDRFAVEAAEIVPADASVVSGAARADESSLTGEPKPVSLSVGDRLKAGTRILDGRVVGLTDRVGPHTILGQMIGIMRQSLEQRTRFEGRTDRLLRRFVPAIVTLAVATGAALLLAGRPIDQAVVRAVTVMVIACPCALGVAIPMTRVAGIAMAGRKGILIRDSEAFERAAAVDTVVFDKTGTLTVGRWRLLEIQCRQPYREAEIVSWAAGLEAQSAHPVATAIRDWARTKGVEPAPAQSVREHPAGVEGRILGKTLRLGSPRFVTCDIPSPPSAACSGSPLTSLVCLSVDDRLAATLVFGDAVRPRTARLIQRLGQRSLALHLVSGDADTVTRAVGRAIGLENAKGDLMPGDKAGYIDSLQQNGRQTAMVGDGINDAPAMARAHMAVALHSGRGLADEAAHVSLMQGDPSQLVDLFGLSKRVNRKVAQNLACAWVYNLISIPIAVSGLLSPLVAATAMLLSSLTVIGNTLLLARERTGPPAESGDDLQQGSQ